MEYSTASLASGLRRQLPLGSPGFAGLGPWALLYGVYLRSSDDGFACCTLGSTVLHSSPASWSSQGFLVASETLEASQASWLLRRLLRLASQGSPYSHTGTTRCLLLAAPL